MPGLLLFLHGLGGNEHTWGGVPEEINSGLDSDYEIATPEYAAGITNISDLNKSASQILTTIRTYYIHHDPIYLIGHSLGGLIAREVCRILLTAGPDELLQKIAAAITMGTPLEGARYANRVLRCIPFLCPKIYRIAQPDKNWNEYRKAIRTAKKRGVRRPKQIHIQMEEDKLIAEHMRDRFTEDDVDGGVVRGGHTNFSATNDSASHIAAVILSTIRATDNAVSPPNRSKVAPVAEIENSSPDRLILIACSHGKTAGGTKINGDFKRREWLPLPNIEQRLMGKRFHVYSKIKDAKLSDGFERGGNRANQPANLELKLGPDVGVNTVKGAEPLYLPAWQRYAGRMYAPITRDTWEAYLQKPNKGFQILIMSGLYGLIDPADYIQNYDVHLTDTDEQGQSVSSMWSELFSDCLVEYVKRVYNGRKVKIIDLLCDENYVNAIQWHRLPAECSVYHLASTTLKDVHLLPAAGTILRSLLDNQAQIETLERHGKVYDLTDFGPTPQGMSDVKVIFESRVGEQNFSNKDD